MTYSKAIAALLNLREAQVEKTLELLAEGATLPFIARYRKEMTGSLDEVEIAAIKSHAERLADLDKRRETILKAIEEQGKLTPELRKEIEQAETMTQLEDLYLPYKVKRKTRASKARELGLEPLADILMAQRSINFELAVGKFLTDQVLTLNDALQGARDIIAERVNEDAQAREKVRFLFGKEAILTATLIKGKEAEGDKYRDYFEFSKALKSVTSHQLLAIRRAENEGILRVDISPDEENVLYNLDKIYLSANNECTEQVGLAIKDAYKRLLQPSIETEFRLTSKEKADDEAINIFTNNLRQLLLAAPLGEKRVLALDPGYRTGCKLICLDENGKLLHNGVIYPHTTGDVSVAVKTMQHCVKMYGSQAIAIGNGTASRETEEFVRKIDFGTKLQIFVVSENGASIYSASDTAREEFPDHDVTVRGAISIGRRLMDPLAELVKIDPKSIGVGQYQHDVEQRKLQTGLDTTVESCVNAVGVNLNTASRHLLTYVSGLGPALASSIVAYRDANGAFKSRKELKKVPRLGDKAFEQCAGFLRIRDAANPLDASAVHPERYELVERMAKDLGCKVTDLMTKADLRKQINLKNYVSEQVGLPTLNDIMKELEKPGLDPREQLTEFSFDDRIRSIDDVYEGMVLPGIVTNLTAFGAFVDIGIKENGLIHKSQIANRWVESPSDVLKLQQQLTVKVLAVERDRGRVQLTLKF